MSQPHATAARGTPAPPRPGGPVTAPPTGMPVTPLGGAAAYPRAQRGGRARSWLAAQFEGTPGRMRLLGALAALASVVFGLVAAWSLWSAGQALDRAGAATDQVLRVQAIHADLLRADSDATNAFLVAGLEDPAQRADYDAAIQRVASTLAHAATEQPADADALAALNVAVSGYVSLVDQARAYNRQGLPVGQAYITKASDTLRSTAVPILEALLQADTDRARAEFSAASNFVGLLVVGALATVVLALIAVWVARRTHRYLNVGLTGATAAVLVGLIVGLVVLANIGSDVRRVSGTAFEGTRALTVARTAAFEARADESLGLIKRGQAGSASSAATPEGGWAAADRTVINHLDGLTTLPWRGGPTSADALRTAWTAYEKAHATVRSIDDGGAWDFAVSCATATTVPTDPTGTFSCPTLPRATFAAFEQASSTALDSFRTALAADVRSPVATARATAIALLVLGLAGAVLATRGMSRRLEEYR